MSRLFMLMLLVVGTGASRQGNSRSVNADGWRTKLLTRDGTDDWNFEAKPGLVLRATVQSTDFDPTIQLLRLDGGGAVSLVEKDDEGSTSTFTYRLEQGGKFQIRIYGFEHTGGGNYRLQINRFQSHAMQVGKDSAGQFDKQGQAAFRFKATKGDILSFSHRGPVRRVQFFMESLVPVSTWSNTLFVHTTGIYYVRLSGQRDKCFGFELERAQRSELSLGNAQSITMSPRSIRVFEFSAKAREFRLIHLKNDRGLQSRLVRIASAEKEGIASLHPPRMKNIWHASKGGQSRQAFVLLEGGQFQYHLLSTKSAPSDVQIELIDPAVAIAPGEAMQGKLRLGSSRFYVFEAKIGQLLDVDLHSDSFDPMLVLSDPDGNAIASDDDSGESLGSRIMQMITRSGTYRLQVSSVGNGGGGDYALRLQCLPVPTLRLDGEYRRNCTHSNTSYWHFAGKRGQELLLSSKSVNIDTSLQVYGPMGNLLAHDKDSGTGHNSLLAIRLPRNGLYTIGVRADQGSGKYTLRVIKG